METLPGLLHRGHRSQAQRIYRPSPQTSLQTSPHFPLSACFSFDTPPSGTQVLGSQGFPLREKPTSEQNWGSELFSQRKASRKAPGSATPSGALSGQCWSLFSLEPFPTSYPGVLSGSNTERPQGHTTSEGTPVQISLPLGGRVKIQVLSLGKGPDRTLLSHTGSLAGGGQFLETHLCFQKRTKV